MKFGLKNVHLMLIATRDAKANRILVDFTQLRGMKKEIIPKMKGKSISSKTSYLLGKTQ
jgi:hypothetical protein